MTEVKTLAEWKKVIKPALISKKEEFHLTGYESVTDEELWRCLISRSKKKKQEEWLLHQAVNFVLTLSVNDFMNWLTIESYQGDSWFSGDEPLKLNNDA
jgi:hypothetical protein